MVTRQTATGKNCPEKELGLLRQKRCQAWLLGVWLALDGAGAHQQEGTLETVQVRGKGAHDSHLG